MQVSIETTSGLERRLTIVVDFSAFEDQVTTRLKATAQRVRIDGFRPGKVPLKEVRRRFGEPVRQEVAGELMQSSFFEAIQQEKISPASQPLLEVLKMDPGSDFEFTATFEVFPNVDLVDLARVSVKKPIASIAESDIDKMLNTLREQRKSWKPVTRESADGDQLTVDFKGSIAGEDFAGGSGEDVSFVLGQGQMLPEFESATIGVAAGTTIAAEVTFPETYQAEDLRGKTANFEITVKQVAEPELPEMDEEFFKSFGIDEGGLEAMRAEVGENMQRELDGAVRTQLKKQVLDELARLHQFSVPASLIAKEINNLKSQMLQQFNRHGQGQNLPELPDDMFREEAEKRVRTGLVINQIVDTKALKAEPDSVRARIEELAQSYSEPDQVVNWYYSNEEQLSQIEMAVLEDSVIDKVIEKAVVEEIATDYENAISGQALAPAEPAEIEADKTKAAEEVSD